jgi:small subunit ribosomal protein S13
MASEQQPEEAKKKKEKYEPKAKRSVQVVRILGTDVDGSKNLVTGIASIVGVGNNLANGLIVRMGMDRKVRLKDLSDADIDRIEKAIADPAALGIPPWMLNRRKDMETGGDKHLNTSDWKFAVKSDIDLMGEMKSYKGLRHAKGLKVRGQRTASTGRGRVAVGVQKKKTMAQAIASAKSGKEDKKK